MFFGGFRPRPDGCADRVARAGVGAKLGKRAGSTYDIVASSDGRSIYALEVDDEGVAAIELFARRPNGTLRRTGGRTGCLHKTGPAGCKGGRGLRLIEGLALSPDGHSLYVTSLYESYAGSVSIFDRGPTGALTQSPGTEACLSADGGECAVDKALSEAGWIAVSPDGTAVYVTSLWGLAVLGRSENGALTVPAGPAGPAACLSDFHHACAQARNFEATSGVSVSPDGANVYATSFEPGGVSVLTR